MKREAQTGKLAYSLHPLSLERNGIAKSKHCRFSILGAPCQGISNLYGFRKGFVDHALPLETRRRLPDQADAIADGH